MVDTNKKQINILWEQIRLGKVHDEPLEKQIQRRNLLIEYLDKYIKND